MKGYRLHTGLLAGLLTCTTLASCFKEEPLNAECDIEQVSLHLDHPLGTLFSLADTLQRVASADSLITFSVRHSHEADLSTLQPRFILTPGATITPTGGTVDARQGGRRHYRVTSENQLWHRDYTVAFVPVVRTVNDTVAYDFEHFELEPREGKYYIWHNPREDGTLANDWANGNPGFRLSMGSARAEEYPSAPLAQGRSGYGLQLTTRSTGPFGVLARKRLAAGNFFLGAFDVTNALSDALRATSFGVPFDREPLALTGFYKYQPGPVYQDKNGQPIEGRTDQAAIYAVLYRNHDDQGRSLSLHGDDVKTSPQIVAIADMGTVPPTAEWTAFRLDFDYRQAIDYDLLTNRSYSLAIVFSSSNEGDQFEGAVGSQLCIDQVRVVCHKAE